MCSNGSGTASGTAARSSARSTIAPRRSSSTRWTGMPGRARTNRATASCRGWMSSGRAPYASDSRQSRVSHEVSKVRLRVPHRRRSTLTVPRGRAVAHHPHLRVEQVARAGRRHLVYSAFQPGEHSAMAGWHGDLARLAEHRDAARVPADRFEQPHGLEPAVATFGLARVEQGEGDRGGQQRFEVERERGADPLVEVVAGRRPQRVEQRGAVIRAEHRSRSPRGCPTGSG